MDAKTDYIRACTERLLAKARQSFLSVPCRGNFSEVHEWEKAPETLFRDPLAFQLVLMASNRPGHEDVRLIETDVVNGAYGYKAFRMVFCGTMQELSVALSSTAFREEVVKAFLHLKDTALQG